MVTPPDVRLIFLSYVSVSTTSANFTVVVVLTPQTRLRERHQQTVLVRLGCDNFGLEVTRACTKRISMRMVVNADDVRLFGTVNTSLGYADRWWCGPARV